MGDAPDRGPALIVDHRLAAIGLQGVGTHMRPALVLLVVAQFAVKPERRMRPEKQEGAAKQRQHELRSQPGVGITNEIMVVRVRLEGYEPRCRADMAVLAGLEAIGREHGRSRIIDALDLVTAVAVEALGSEGEAQRV